MTTTIASAKKFQELLELQDHDLPYVFDKIFSADTWGAKSLSKKKFKLLKQIDPEIQAMLRENEKVYFITSGIETSFFESFFFGWLVNYLNRKAFVLTTRRILILQINSKNKPMALKAQITYPAIEKISHSLFGACQIKFKNKETRVFAKVPKKDSKFMQTVIGYLKSNDNTVDSGAAGMENLCPYCYAQIKGFPASCQSCDNAFKSPSKAAWLSFIFPGLGDLYLGQHKGLAVFEIIIACFVWLGALTPEESGLTLADYLVEAILIIAIVHGMDALATWHVAKKGIYPADKKAAEPATVPLPEAQ